MQINMYNLLQALIKGSTGSGPLSQLSGKKEETANEEGGLFLSFMREISSVPEDLSKDKIFAKTEEQPEITASLLPVDVEDRNMVLPENNLINQRVVADEPDVKDETVNMAKDFEKTDVAISPEPFKVDSDNKAENFQIPQKSNINFFDMEAKKDNSETNLNNRIGAETKLEFNNNYNKDNNKDIKNRPDTQLLRSETNTPFEGKNYGSDLKRIQDFSIKQESAPLKQASFPIKQDFSMKNDVMPWQKDGGDNTENPKNMFSTEGEERPEVSSGSNSDHHVKASAVLSSQFKEEMHIQQRAANVNVSNTELSQETKSRVINQVVEHASFFKVGKLDAVRIQLKPESLGQLKLEILTENKQITLRIVTELHAVRGIIEENLGQLRADLRNSGLEINKCEVLVGGETDKGHGQSFARFFMADVFKRTEGNRLNPAGADNDDSGVELIPDGRGTSTITENGVDCFV